MEKATLGFRIYKIWQILKHFAGTFHRAQTMKFGGVQRLYFKTPDLPNAQCTYALKSEWKKVQF